MPAKNKVKILSENTCYHAYNRGYNRQEIFRDGHDYATFLYLFKKYLEPGFQERRMTAKGEEYFIEPDHVYEEVDLVSFCLIPNHFHLQLFQRSAKGMPKLLNRLCTSYATYFNAKYQLEGSPFQDTYKAVTIKTEEQHVHVSRYIHINPAEIIGGAPLETYSYSSYPYYLNGNHPLWLKPQTILNLFGNNSTYKSFIEAYSQEQEQLKGKEYEPLFLEG